MDGQNPHADRRLLTVFVVQLLEAAEWKQDGGDYYLQTGGAGGAIAAARRDYTKDGTPRRVVSWPEGKEVWRFDAAPTRRQQKCRA